MEQNGETRNKPIFIWSINVEQRRQECTMGIKVSSTNGAENTEQLHAKE